MSPDVLRSRRRSVLVGTGLGAVAAVLAACSSYGKKPDAESSSGTSAPSSAPPGTAEAAAPLAKTTDVPVGSGLIVGETVVTQAVAGDFKGFSSVCPHAGCNVNQIVDGNIVCPCHGSRFNLDGSVAKGPAKGPLEPKPVTVQGDAIFEG